MSETNPQTEGVTPSKAKAPSAPATPAVVRSRRTLRRLGRQKRQLKLKADAAFAKAFFEAKSKRSQDKSTAFRKKKKNKK